MRRRKGTRTKIVEGHAEYEQQIKLRNRARFPFLRKEVTNQQNERGVSAPVIPFPPPPFVVACQVQSGDLPTTISIFDSLLLSAAVAIQAVVTPLLAVEMSLNMKNNILTVSLALYRNIGYIPFLSN